MLSVVHILFTADVERSIVLGTHKGAAIRGAMFNALRGRVGDTAWRGFCGNQSAPECFECPLIHACPVALLLANHDPQGKRGAKVPNPFMVKPCLGEQQDFLPGDTFRFWITLAGQAIFHLPYVIMAAQQGLPHEGLGNRDRLNDFRRGTLRLRSIHAYHPLNGTLESLWQKGEGRVKPPTAMVHHQEILAYASTLSPERLTLKLHTPMRLMEERQPLRIFRFRPFFQRLLERLMDLSRYVGDAPFFTDELERRALLAAAEAVTVIDQTRWEQLHSYSGRSQHRDDISGLSGTVTLVGALAPFIPWLLWGAQVQIGKDTVKGNGWYETVSVRGESPPGTLPDLQTLRMLG